MIVDCWLSDVGCWMLERDRRWLMRWIFRGVFGCFVVVVVVVVVVALLDLMMGGMSLRGWLFLYRQYCMMQYGTMYCSASFSRYYSHSHPDYRLFLL